jgi:hypothetical protein
MNDGLEVSLSTGLYVPNVQQATAATRNGLVYLLIDGKMLEMRTPAAHKTGFAMVKQAGSALPGEHVVLKVNGDALNFPPEGAKQVGAALLRKADDADDFQIMRTDR